MKAIATLTAAVKQHREAMRKHTEVINSTITPENYGPNYAALRRSLRELKTTEILLWAVIYKIFGGKKKND